MITAALIVDKDYSDNKIFDKRLNNSIFDGRAYKYIKLKEELEKYNIDLITYDLCTNIKPDIYIYLDSVNRIKTDPAKQKFLIIIEPPSVYKANHRTSVINKYEKIFTWDDSVIDNIKYFKYNLSFNLDSLKSELLNIKRMKSIVMIARNKVSTHKNELYSHRKDIIKWYEKNAPNEFDLFGQGWDEKKIKLYPFHYLNRNKTIGRTLYRLFEKKLTVYKGTIKSKSQILSNYDFSYTYENIEGIKGYITEKIIDSFFSLTIPIYRGADNILDYIPNELFIDSRHFDSIEDIHKYISSISKNKIIEIRKDIIDFFQSKDSEIFCAGYNASIIAKEINASIKRKY